MSSFALSKDAAMFAVTPVENSFLLEYMPSAKPSYVKVYLYGLMACYQQDDTLDAVKMASLLSLTEEEVLSAYRYWERKGLVRRVSDRPPMWQYLSCTQRMLQPVELVDERYADFCEGLQSLFGAERRLTGSEMSQAYEWVEQLGLPEDVVMLLVQHKIAASGKHFKFQTAEKLAMQLKDEAVDTVEEAEQFLSRSQELYAGCKTVLRRLGIRRNPSDDELALYHKWVIEWGFAPDAVKACCAETVKGSPNFAYLDGVIAGIRERQGALTSEDDYKAQKAASDDLVEQLKEVKAALGSRELTVNDETISLYRQMTALYPREVILMAARVCARGGRSSLDDVMKGLRGWQQKGLTTAKDVSAYLEAVRAQDQLIDAIYEQWGKRPVHSAPNRDAVAAWRGMGFADEAVLKCAGYAREADRPFAYLSTLMDSYSKLGLRTSAEIEAEHTKHATATTLKGGRKLPEQQYTQRTYEDRGHVAEDWLIALAEENNDTQ